MNLVKTYVDKSPIQGLGLFAGEFIPKGTLIWELNEPFDVVIDNRVWKAIKHGAQSNFQQSILDHIDTYSFFKDGKLVLCGDNAKYANHSKRANTVSTLTQQYAKQDIQIGEEIFCDYREICDDFDENNL